MFLNEMLDGPPKDVLVIFPGRFQPFHRGHKAIYDHLSKQYGANKVFVATSNKVNLPNSPFDFNEKLQMINATGIDSSQVVQTIQPYQAQELVDKYDAETTVLLFAVSEKDMADDPRFKFKEKRDGSPSYFQPMPADPEEALSLSKHGYIITVPTVDFTILDKPVQSATEIRNLFAVSDEKTRVKIISALYGKLDHDIYNIFVSNLGTSEVTEDEEDHGHGAPEGDPKVAFLNRQAQIEHPYASSPAEALALYILNHESDEIAKLQKTDERELDMLDKLQDVDRDLKTQLADMRAEIATFKASMQNKPIADQENEVSENSVGAVATVTNPDSKKPKSQVGSLFGGTYKVKKKKK